MPSKLAKPAAISFVIALACLTAGSSLVGRHDDSSWRPWHWRSFTGWGACTAKPQSGEIKNGSITLP